MNKVKWYNAKDVTNSKKFPEYEAAMAWCKNLEAAGSVKGELMLEKSCNKEWTVYW